MFAFLSRSQRKSLPARSGSFRPMLEKLEDRDCPSTISLSVNVVPFDKWVTVWGRVTDTSSPGGLTVQFSGVASGTVTTSSDGSFMTMLCATGLGNVYAATTDGQSNTAQVTLVDPSGTINQFNWSESPGGMFSFTGHVAGGYYGETINFGGLRDLQGQSATLDSNGNFSINVVLDGQIDDNGNATAQSATDAWGAQSNLATVWVSQT